MNEHSAAKSPRPKPPVRTVLRIVFLVAMAVGTLALVDLVEQTLSEHVEHVKASETRKELRRTKAVYDRRIAQLEFVLARVRSPKEEKTGQIARSQSASTVELGIEKDTHRDPDAAFRDFVPSELESYRRATVAEYYELRKRALVLDVTISDLDQVLRHRDLRTAAGQESATNGGRWFAQLSVERWLDDVVREGTYAHAILHLGNLLGIFVGYALLAVALLLAIDPAFGQAFSTMLEALKDWTKQVASSAPALVVAGAVAAGGIAGASVLPDVGLTDIDTMADLPPDFDEPSVGGPQGDTITTNTGIWTLYSPVTYWGTETADANRRVAAALERIAERLSAEKSVVEAPHLEAAVAAMQQELANATKRADQRTSEVVLMTTRIDELKGTIERVGIDVSGIRHDRVAPGDLDRRLSDIAKAIENTSVATGELKAPMQALSDSAVDAEKNIACGMDFERWRTTRGGWTRIAHWFKGSRPPC